MRLFKRGASHNERKGASVNYVHKNFGFFYPLPLAMCGTDLHYKIHTTSFTMSAFP